MYSLQTLQGIEQSKINSDSGALKMKDLNDYQKLDWISFAIQEALNGNLGELEQALELVENLLENSLTEMEH
tara:strand:- start:160 stop:375 length:216 start_codon:yes stop_codon:yes gene_type:complete